MSGSENIQIPKDLKINSQELKDFTVPFTIDIKVSDFLIRQHINLKHARLKFDDHMSK